MVDVYTGVAALDYDTTAYDQMAYYAFRPELYFDTVADVRPTNQSHVGSAVVFSIQNDLAVASTPLAETTDVSAVAMSDSQVTVTLAEYGNAVVTTALVRGTSFLDVDPLVANVIGYNAGISIDTVARNVVQVGTNVAYGGSATSRTTVAANTLLTGNDVRKAKARLRAANVPTIGGSYMAIIHPDVAYDFTGASGGANFRDPHTYSQPNEIWTGEIGMFEGFRFVEAPRAPLFADASNGAGAGGTIDVYRTLFMGRQAIAKAYSNVDGNGANPRVIPGPVTDKLRRFVPMGWYWLGGYGIFRQNAIYAVETASSIGVNT
jgi:N4-gp56 family major capsid protein